MIPDLGPYAVYVLAAYGVSILLLVAIVAQSLIRAAAIRRKLGEIEARDVSARAKAPRATAGTEAANG